MNALTGSKFPSGLVDPELADMVAEITDRLNTGERVDITDYPARCPGREQRLRALIEALRLVQTAGSSAPTRTVAEPVPGILGDYRIIREVGRGGMGIVYEAEQISLARRVALKVLPFAATMDQRHLQRFQNEARAAASLEHEHIVPVYAVGCDRSVHFYAMKFIEGQTLAELIRARHGEPAALAAGCESSPGEPAALAAGCDAQHPAANAAGSPVDATAAYADTAPIAQLSTQHSTKDPAFFRTVAELGIQAADAFEHAHSMGVVHRDIKPANLMVSYRQSATGYRPENAGPMADSR